MHSGWYSQSLCYGERLRTYRVPGTYTNAPHIDLTGAVKRKSGRKLLPARLSFVVEMMGFEPTTPTLRT